jgi:hypothetical protein
MGTCLSRPNMEPYDRIQMLLPDLNERNSCGILYNSPQDPGAICGCIVVVLNEKIRNLFAPASPTLLQAKDFLESLDEPIKGLVDQGNETLYSEEEGITVFLCGYS